MLTFREFLLEEIDTQATTDGGDASFVNPEALQNINSNLAAIGQMKFISPYQGLNKIRKALATFNIHFGDYVFDLEDEDEAVFAIQQFGEKEMEADDGTISNDTTVMYLYIMMTHLEDGTFEVDSEIVDEDQLHDILDDDADLEELPDERYYNDVHEETLVEMSPGTEVTYQKNKKERGNAKIKMASKAKKDHYYIDTEHEGTINGT